MRLTGIYKEEFLQIRSDNAVESFRLKHGQRVYEAACVECLSRKKKLNQQRLNYMLAPENVCKFILVLGFSNIMKYNDFFEFLSYSYTRQDQIFNENIDELDKDNSFKNAITQEQSEPSTYNFELIIKLLIQGYNNLILQKSTNLNVQQLHESDEQKLIQYYESVKAETNPIGKMQEFVSRHSRINLIQEYSDDEQLNLSFLGIFRLSPSSSAKLTKKKDRKTVLFRLTLPFILFFTQQQRVFDVDATYKPIVEYWKIFQNSKGEDADLLEVISSEEELLNKQIKQKMGQNELFQSLEAISNQQTVAFKPIVKTREKTQGMNSNKSNNKGQILGTNGNTRKQSAFISFLSKNQEIRDHSKAAGLLETVERDPTETKILEALTFSKDSEIKSQENKLIQAIMAVKYDSSNDAELEKQNNPKGLLLEMASKHFKTVSCFQFKIFQIPQREFECVLLFPSEHIHTRGRATSKSGCEKVASAKMIPLLEEYLKDKAMQLNRPSKVVLFSTNTNKYLKKTDKLSHEIKNLQPMIQQSLENNLYIQPSLQKEQAQQQKKLNKNNQQRQQQQYQQQQQQQFLLYPSGLMFQPYQQYQKQ